MFGWKWKKNNVHDIIGEKLKPFFTKDNLLILILAGVLLLVISIPVGDKKQKKETIKEMTEQKETEKADFSETQYVEQLKKQLEAILKEMDGVGDVRVMITLKETQELVVEKNMQKKVQYTRETDSNGGSRIVDNQETEQGAIEAAAEQGTAPFVIKKKYPKIEGVVVLAQEDGKTLEKAEIAAAVQALFGLEAHKVKVLKMGHISSNGRIQ